MKTAPRYLMLLLTTACNLRCAYCYREEEVHPLSMPRETAMRGLRLAASSGLPFHVQMTGGEPTLQPELIEWVASTTRKAGWPATLALQTNGTTMDRALVRLCAKYDIQVGVSLDGPPEVQEKLRGGALATIHAMKLLSQEGVPFRVTTVVTQQNAAHLKQIPLLLGAFKSARGVGMDLFVRKGRGVKGGVSQASAESLEKGITGFMATLSGVNARRTSPLRLREMDLLEQAFHRKKNPPFCHACKGESLAIHPDGTIYPCSQTAGDPLFAAGTLDHPDRERLMTLKRFTLFSEECKTCVLADRCPGDCPGRQYYNRGEAIPLACVMYRTLWNGSRKNGDFNLLLNSTLSDFI